MLPGRKRNGGKSHPEMKIKAVKVKSDKESRKRKKPAAEPRHDKNTREGKKDQNRKTDKAAKPKPRKKKEARN